MSRQNHNKLQNLLMSWYSGTVVTTKWLGTIGVSRKLANVYKKNGWMTSFGSGAYSRHQDKIEWYGALYALQFQLGLDVHVGAKTALDLQGVTHYIPLGRGTVDLLKSPRVLVPRWFKNHEWEERLRISEFAALPPSLEIQEFSMGNHSIKISSRERAALELLHLAPRLYDFEEVRLIMDSLGTLRADVLTELLQQCRSEKARRLLLYFGDVQKHAWRDKIEIEKLQMSSTLLKIVSTNGKYNAKYNLFIPHEYVIQNDKEIEF